MLGTQQINTLKSSWSKNTYNSRIKEALNKCLGMGMYYEVNVARVVAFIIEELNMIYHDVHLSQFEKFVRIFNPDDLLFNGVTYISRLVLISGIEKSNVGAALDYIREHNADVNDIIYDKSFMVKYYGSQGLVNRLSLDDISIKIIVEFAKLGLDLNYKCKYNRMLIFILFENELNLRGVISDDAYKGMGTLVDRGLDLDFSIDNGRVEVETMSSFLKKDQIDAGVKRLKDLIKERC